MSNPETSAENSLEQIASALANQAFVTVEEKYGVEGQNPKGYHNVTHSRDDVVGGAIALADMAIASGKITPKDKALLIISAAFHDIEQDLGSGANEAASSREARAAMRKESVFNQSDEDKVDEIIMGTQIRFDEDGVMLQAASEDNLLCQFMADADLSALGRETPTFWSRSSSLFEEFYGDNPTTEDRIAFLENQVKLLSSHVYYTDEARELFPHQAENLAYTESVLASMAN